MMCDHVINDIPYHSLVLLLSYVGGDFAVDLSGAQRHGQSLSHVRLDLRRDVGVLVGRTNPDVGRAFVFKFASSELRNFCSRYQ